MQSNILKVDGSDEALQLVINEVEDTAKYNKLTKKETIQLELLAEEMIGMQKNMSNVNNSEFFIEASDNAFKLHLKTKTEMNLIKQDEYKKLATDGTNSAYKGFMGKLCMIADTLTQKTVSGYSIYCSDMSEYGNSMNLNLSQIYGHAWILTQELKHQKETKEEWDELEKSIVANLADEIVIGSRNDYVEIIIFRDFKKEK